jgi:hypothetical protein
MDRRSSIRLIGPQLLARRSVPADMPALPAQIHVRISCSWWSMIYDGMSSGQAAIHI